MSATHETWWILGFDAADVRDWQDARIAEAIDTLWKQAGKPSSLQAWWTACSDEYAFRWYLSESLGRALDDAGVSWRKFIIGRSPAMASTARSYLPPGVDEQRTAVMRAAS